MALVKAMLEVIKGSNEGLKVPVQFNPQSLHVNHRQAAPPSAQAVGINSGKQGVSLQQTGYTAEVTMELLFDTSQSGEDVRNTTLKIAAMIQPKGKDDNNAISFVQFSWGTFIFKGAILSMNETLDLFSEQGVPLRATVSLSMIELEWDRANAGAGAGAGLGFSASAGFSAGVSAGFSAGAEVGFSASASLNAGIAVGTTPLTLSQSGDTLQSLTGRAGINGSWKAVASANNIDNPRQMDPGTILNLNASAGASVNL